MKYSVNWIEKNMGISRKTLRYYEDKKLIKPPRNLINNYREYSEEDIYRIWTIKTLIGMKFKINQIEDWIKNPENFDFYKVISDNVIELEKDYKENKIFLDIARTIKVTGRIPVVNEVGCVKFDDFMNYVRNNWNFVNEKHYKEINSINNINENIDNVIHNPDIDALFNFFKTTEIDKIAVHAQLEIYYKILSGLYMYPEDNEIILYIVDQLFKYVNQFYLEFSMESPITVEQFVKAFSLEIFEGDIDKINKRMYGEKGIKYITKALESYRKYKLNIKNE